MADKPNIKCNIKLFFCFNLTNTIYSQKRLNTKIKNICVIGNGSWATALIKILCESSKDIAIKWVLKNQDDIDFVKQHGHNPRYLTDVQIDFKTVELVLNQEEGIIWSDMVLVAVPSAFVNGLLSKLPPTIFKNKIILSAVKGVIPETHQIISHYFESTWQVPSSHIAAVSGPCHAEEVALEKLSYLTIATSNNDLGELLMPYLNCYYILSKYTADIYGIEYSSVLKNVYAIAGGICHGLGYGDNFQAVLVSSAAREIERFLEASHQTHRDVKENAYLGDLLVTAYSQFSRNRTFGNMIGKGYTVKSAQMEMNMIAEGYYATKTMHDINENVRADMPILNSVFEIIYNHQSAKKVMKELTEKLI